MEQRLRCSVLSVVVLGAICALASGCGSKKEETPDNTTATTLTPESAAAPALTVPPPTPVVVPPPPPPATAPPKVEKADPDAEAKVVVGCCAAIRRESLKAKGAEKQKLSALRTTCTDLSVRVSKGESTRDKAMSAIKAAGAGLKLPSDCS